MTRQAGERPGSRCYPFPMSSAPSPRVPLLGGTTVRAFLRRSWHKQALRVTGALPGFRGLHSLAELKALAARDDVESRLVVRSGREYTLAHGPLRNADFRGLPQKT